MLTDRGGTLPRARAEWVKRSSGGHPPRASCSSCSPSSGFSGLIYESLWTHYLKLFLGHAAYAQTLVLAIFMGGMAVGSWLCGRWSARWPNLLRGYALAEAVIGLIALAFHSVFERSVSLAYSTLMPALGSVEAVMAFKWGLAALLILPQSILLGMTFPLMAGGMIRRAPDQPGTALATLYFCNSVGGALGVLASGFLLIRFVGLPGTGAVAGAINLALAAVAWWQAGSRPEPAFLGPSESPEMARDRGRYALLLLVALLTGAASFIYEVGWIRLLSLVLGSSTHAFELMLSAFILGLAFGGLWIRRRIDTLGEPLRFLGVVQVAMGLLALSTLYLYNSTFGVMRWLVATLPKTGTGYLEFNLASHAVAAAIMLPTTFCAGTTLPLITYCPHPKRAGRGKHRGRLRRQHRGRHRGRLLRHPPRDADPGPPDLDLLRRRPRHRAGPPASLAPPRHHRGPPASGRDRTRGQRHRRDPARGRAGRIRNGIGGVQGVPEGPLFRGRGHPIPQGRQDGDGPPSRRARLRVHPDQRQDRRAPQPGADGSAPGGRVNNGAERRAAAPAPSHGQDCRQHRDGLRADHARAAERAHAAGRRHDRDRGGHGRGGGRLPASQRPRVPRSEKPDPHRRRQDVLLDPQQSVRSSSSRSHRTPG